MRRIYIESLVSLIVLFFGSLVSYSFIVYELDTDYDYVLEDYQAEALQTLLSQIRQLDSPESAKTALRGYAEHIHKTVDLLPHYHQKYNSTFRVRQRILLFSTMMTVIYGFSWTPTSKFISSNPTATLLSIKP